MRSVRCSCKTVSICTATVVLALFLMLALFTVSVNAETEAGTEASADEAEEPATNTDAGAGAEAEDSAEKGTAKATPSAGWKKDNAGWKYIDKNGNSPSNQWCKIDDRWYHFSESGYMQHGWIKDNDRWYYLGWTEDAESGAMQHGWIRDNGRWYYLGWPEDAESGAMRHGWVKLDDRWYYFGSPDNPDSGAMRRGWFKDNDKWYYMGWEDDDESGAMRTGWVKLGEQWYYFGSPDNNDSGNMRHGWAELGERWYYFGRSDDADSGAMQHGWLELEDAWYYLGHPDNDESGVMVIGVMNTRKADEEAKYYYFDDNGAWKEICRNVSQDETDWVVIKGVATEVVTESDKTLYRAMDLLTSITTDDMTDEEKLRTAFECVKDFTYMSGRVPHYNGLDWPVAYANDIFIGTGDGRQGTKGGNCFSYAAAFAYMVKAIGYEDVYACHSVGHGWTEVDGLVYDINRAKFTTDYTYYGLTYEVFNVATGYQCILSPQYAYMHIKM